MGFFDILAEVVAVLQREGRVTYWALAQEFGFDAAFLDGIRRELLFKQVARDEQGLGLVWTGRTQPAGAPAVQEALPAAAAVVSPAPLTLPPLTLAPAPSSTAPTTAAAHVSTVPQPVAPHTAPENGRPAIVPTAPPVTARAEPNAPVTVVPAVPSDMGTTTPPGAGRSAPEAERRQLTVMFCDLVGSTTLSGQLDPEVLREVVRAYQETAAQVMQQFAGHIAQYLGDGLLVYFGYPQAYGDEAQRAVHTALGIVAAMDTLNSRLQTDYGVQLAVRIGIHTGPVVVGQMGGGGRYEQLALGETPNIAARLEGLAAPNTVVISPMTARLVAATCILEALGPQTLKGVAEPLEVWRVCGLRDLHQERLEEATPDDGARLLVGRDEELGLLRRRWAQSKEGLGQVVLITGEAGIGKSSLVQVIRDQVAQEGLPRITFRCSPYHTHSALYPVITHLHRLLQFAREDPPDVKLAKLERGLQPYALLVEAVVPLLAALLSVPLPEGCYPALPLSPPQQRQQTLDALNAWLLAEAERHPTLVLWEDLHWADPTTLELLGGLVEQVPTVALLSVLTFRPEFVPPWPPRSHLTPLTLNRLERPQVEALITRLARGKRLPPEVVAYIVTRTDGVPLYVEELTKALLESDVLVEQANQYRLTRPLADVAIPATLQDSLMARLDRLPTVREVAQLGAVLGREFAYEMLQALMGGEEACLQEGLAQLVGAELLYQRGRPPRAKYIFKHALVQDAAYQSILRRTRQHYHQQVAQLFETRFVDLVQTEPELVAHHYTEAGCSAQAIPYWQQAGQQALQRSANLEAVRHLSTALALLATLPETTARAQHELDLQIALGPALMTTKGQGAPDVEQIYARARELCRQVGEMPQLFPVLWGLWRFYFIRAEHQTARELAEQCLSLAQRLQDPGLFLGAHFALGGTLLFCGEFAPARASLEQGMALYDPQVHRALAFQYGQDPGVTVLSYAAWALWLLGYPDQALQRIHEALTLAQALSHPLSLAAVLTYAAQSHCWRVEGHAAQEWAETAMALSSEQGFPQFLSLGTIYRGWALAIQGQAEEGIAQIRQGLTARVAMGIELERSWLLVALAEAYGKVDQVHEGLHVLAEALALLDNTGERMCEAELHRLKGELLLMVSMDHHAEVEACFHHALDVARQQQAKSLELRAAVSLARLWQQQGKRDEARALLAPIYGWFTEGFDTVDLQEAQALLEALGG